MRDFMMLGAMIALIPLSFYSAFGAYLLWGWTGVLTPGNYLYGFMQSVRYNMLFGLITLVMLFAGGLRDKGKFAWTPTTVLLILFAIHALVAASLGYEDNPFNWQYFSNLLKILVFALLMPIFMTSRMRIHAFLIVLIFGLGLHGVLEGAKYLVSGGGHRVAGIPMSMIGDNNHFAVALVMSIPIAYYLFRYSQITLTRLGFLSVTVLLVIAVIGTYSRGAFVCLSIVGIWFVISSRHKFAAFIVISVAIALVMAVAADTWFDRIASIQDAAEDGSFMGRVSAWKASSGIALGNPIFGGGFHAVQVPAVWDSFKSSQGILPFVSLPEVFIREIPRAAHSIYFEVMGDLGFVGLGIFLALLVRAQIVCVQVRKLSKLLGPSADWARDLANMLGISLIAYMVGGASVSLAYYELVYVIIMLIEVVHLYLKGLARNEDAGAGNGFKP